MNRPVVFLGVLLRTVSDRASLAVLLLLSGLLLALEYHVLVVPDATYVTIWLSDVFGLADSGYRVAAGQVPSVDFSSLYGAAAFYPVALGFKFGFNAAGALAFGHFITAIFLLGMAVLASYRRLPLLPAIVFIVFLFLLIAVPVRLGGRFDELTYAIFYTRHGWAALAIALLFYLEPRDPGRRDLLTDTAVQSSLLVYLFNLKITFAMVALAFVIANAITSRYKFRSSVATLVIIGVVFGCVQLLASNYNAAYVGDFSGVVQGTPLFRNGISLLMSTVAAHAGIFVLCYTALAAVALEGRCRFFDFAFITGCIAASLMILDTSGGTIRGLPALICVFLIFGELARRHETSPATDGASTGSHGNVASIAIFGMLLAFVAEPIMVDANGLRVHRVKTALGQARSGGLSGIHVREVPLGARGIHDALGHDEVAHAQFNELRTGPLKPWEYLPLVGEGIELLESVPYKGRSVIALAETNPFSVILQMRPTKNGQPLSYAGNRSAARRQRYLELPLEVRQAAAQRFISDADYVMVPTVPNYHKNTDVLYEMYGFYLEANFYELRRSPHWRLYARRSEDLPPEDPGQ